MEDVFFSNGLKLPKRADWTTAHIDGAPPLKSMSVDTNRFHDFRWDISYPWIFGYTLWNWLFIAIDYPSAYSMEAFILAVPLCISLFQRKLWLQARAYTLSFYLMIGFCFPTLVTRESTDRAVDDHTLLRISVICLCGVTLFWLRSLFKKTPFWLN
jgi:hypothetical protein